VAEVPHIDRVITQRIVTKIGGGVAEKNQPPIAPIGIFDSGVGGLTVLKEIARQLPNEDVIYIADTARVPYGSRPPEEIIKINEDIISYLVQQGVKIIVLACGTSSAVAYPILKNRFNTAIVSLIGPGARAAILASNNGFIGVIATVNTIESQAYQNTLKELHKDVVVTAVATPLLVPLIEGGFVEADETRRVLQDYLKPIIENGCDTLILGCTHYPHVAGLIQEILGPGVTLVDPAIQAVEETKALLAKRNLLKVQKGAKYTFLVTGSVVQFEELGSRLMNRTISGVKQIGL